MNTPAQQRTRHHDRSLGTAASAQSAPTRVASHNNPLLLWTALASQASEMMLASAQVIGHRTGRMATAGAAPSADDMDEFNLMTQEKFDAAAESSWSVTAHWMQLNQQLWTQMLTQMQAGMTAMMSAVTSPSLAESMTHHATFVAAMSPSADAQAQFSNAAADLARSALGPIHARATANAERLGRHQAAADAA